MKTTNLKQSLMALLLFSMLFLTYTVATAQTFQLEIKLKLDDKKSKQECTVQIFNLITGDIVIKPATGKLSAALDYQQEYLIVVSRDGYQPKSIHINTNCNLTEDFLFNCSLTLKPKIVKDNIPYQAGAIYYNNNKNEFDYNYTKN